MNIYIFKNDTFQQYLPTVNSTAKFLLPNGNYVYKTDFGGTASFNVANGNITIPTIYLNKVKFLVKDSTGTGIGAQHLSISGIYCLNDYHTWGDSNGESLFYLFDGNYDLWLHNKQFKNNIYISKDTVIEIILLRVSFIFRDSLGNGYSNINVYFYQPIASKIRSNENGVVSFGLVPGNYSYEILLGNNIGGTILVNKKDTVVVFNESIHNVFVSIVDTKGKPVTTNFDLALTDSTGSWLDQYFYPKTLDIYKFNTVKGKCWIVSYNITKFEVHDNDLYFIYKENLPTLYGTKEQIYPKIINQPVSQEAKINSLVNFKITALNGKYLKYNWQKNGTTIENANDSIYAFYPTSLSDSGEYKCIVSNAFGSDTSNMANLKLIGGTQISSIDMDDVSIVVYKNLIKIISSERILRIDVWGVDGKYVYNTKIKEFQLPKGIYLIKVQTLSKSKYKKVLVY